MRDNIHASDGQCIDGVFFYYNDFSTLRINSLAAVYQSEAVRVDISRYI
jgi:hypothetical protein